ncbi:polysaccharide biosynthesis/export family protein [Candidatus Omnitrophota bacterium]
MKPKNLTCPTVIFLCLSVMFLTSCATRDYRLKSGDELRILIWNKLDEKVTIRPDQKISLPFIGEVDCNHKTPRRLSRELSGQYDKDTTVIVTKSHTWKEHFKITIQLIRDSTILYFIGRRITNESR